ncbi:MAG: PAS domain-containing protein [Vicinamibacteria bacterium]
MAKIPLRPPSRRSSEATAVIEEHLRAQLLDEVADSVEAIVWSANLDGRILYMNAAVERLTGFPAQVFLDDLDAWWAAAEERLSE